jgi:hypothetical protein
MRHKTTCSCSQLLEQVKLPILERARKLSRLEQAVLQLLPAELGEHCKVLNLKNETLVLATSSPAWAGRLRFAAPDLLRRLKRQLSLDIRAIDLRVQPETVENQPIIARPLQLSLRSATLLAQTAQSVNHPPLQEALLRLAAKTREI